MTAAEANDNLLGQYVRAQIRRGLSPESMRHRLCTLQGVATSILPRNLLEVTRVDIEEWLDRPLAPRTRYWHLSNLSTFFAWAIREEWAEVNPTIRIDRPRSRRLLPRPMRKDDLTRALAVADPRTRLWLLLASHQGLRVGEIAQLRREHVLDVNDPALLLIDRGKGGHQRVLPLNATVETALRIYGMPTSGYLFPGKKGHLRPDTISKYLGRYLTSIGVAASAHQARHFFASEVYRISRDLRLTQELLGHANVSTTAGYCAWSPQRAHEVVRDLSCNP